jgi:hypothetical protein
MNQEAPEGVTRNFAPRSASLRLGLFLFCEILFSSSKRLQRLAKPLQGFVYWSDGPTAVR